MPKINQTRGKRMKSISRIPGRQLKITKKDEKVFSTLQFEALPNEIILHVFRYLKIEDLLKCGQVSKRFRSISNDEQYLWPKKINICCKGVPGGFLQKLLDNGCKYLSLSEAIIKGDLNLPKASRLKYLNLSGSPHGENSETLLQSCYSLEKLSLSDFHLSWKFISIISLQNGKTLKVLDLSKCDFCRNVENCIYPHDESTYTVPIKQIVKHCTELIELSLFKAKLSEKSVDILVSKLTSKIEKLDLYDIFYLRDAHVKKLVTRCNKITELNLGGWTAITKNSLNFIIEHLHSTLVKLDLRFTKVEFDSNELFKLKTMTKLTHLCYDHEKRSYVDSRWLKAQLPNLWIHSKPDGKKIGNPRHPPEYNQHHGFWEIKAEREDLFDWRTLANAP